jgi:DNA-binding NarL/FixJ family response regulator
VLQSDPSIELVGEASDYLEGLKLAEEASPQLLLVDIGLKGGPNGIALTRALGERWPELLVLVLSVENGADYVRGAYEAGARGFVTKEAPLAQLLAAIHAVAAGSTFWPKEVDLGGTRDELTPAQFRVAQLLAHGLSNRNVAERLGVAVRTIDRHREDIRKRTGAISAVEIRVWLEVRGLLPPLPVLLAQYP